MKIEDTFTIEKDGAFFTFELPFGNEDLKGKTNEEIANFVFSKKLKRVQGVIRSDGSEISLESAKELALPWKGIWEVVRLYIDKINEMAGVKPEAEEKKEPKSASLNVLDGSGSNDQPSIAQTATN